MCSQVITPLILDILKSKGAHATFYVLGVKAVQYPDILKRMRDEGHEVGNHGWDHTRMTTLKHAGVVDQLQRTSQVIRAAIGTEPTSMRPPYGSTKPALNKVIRGLDMEVIMWDVDTLDWTRPESSAIVRLVKERATSGCIILCHDIMPGTLEALERLVDEVHSKGLRLVTVTDALTKYHNSTESGAETSLRQRRTGAQLRHI